MDFEHAVVIGRCEGEEEEGEGDEEEGDEEAVEKHRVQAEEARLCLPQLNMHGLWVGK